jgi:PPOX class probable FMN-dependent enzyme
MDGDLRVTSSAAGVPDMETSDPAPKPNLRATYPPPLERAVLKAQTKLDAHMRAFIAASPFLVLGTSSAAGADVTPRGDQPGFVQVFDEATLLVPDWPGNNRLDSLSNVLENPAVGLLFFVPGVLETLRVNGRAEVSLDAALVSRWNVNGKQPRSVLRVAVDEAFMHCGKALIRSRLWAPEAQIDRRSLPSYGQMLKDQTRLPQSAEEMQASLEDGYKNRLY